ncbi:hypothetical protein K435DRAFT_881481, partial [Dendrothele bispora CBS 962.96]
MSESKILPEDSMVNSTASEVDETVTQSTPVYHEDEDPELLKAIKMSLEEPDAEVCASLVNQLPEDLMVNPAASAVEKTVTQSTPEDENAELLMVVKMSSGEPDAE